MRDSAMLICQGLVDEGATLVIYYRSIRDSHLPDTADLEAIRHADKPGVLRGAITTPSLAANAEQMPLLCLTKCCCG